LPPPFELAPPELALPLLAPPLLALPLLPFAPPEEAFEPPLLALPLPPALEPPAVAMLDAPLLMLVDIAVARPTEASAMPVATMARMTAYSALVAPSAR
jgi:hypothetical protein